MTSESMTERRVSAEALENKTTQLLRGVGVPEDEAFLFANALVAADARGNNSHGVMRLPVYIDRIRAGGIKPGHKGRILRESGCTMLLDGEDGIGHVVAARAMEEAIRKAQEAGAGLVGVTRSNHFGEAGYYVLQAIEHDMIGIITTNGSPRIPLWGSFSKLTGNLPVAIGVPSAGESPLVLDMALGTVALGKVMYAAEKGEKIPPGWGVDAQGRPTDEPVDVLSGGWTPPIGAYKGSGLMLMAEILSGVLTGGPFADEIGHMYGDPSFPQGLGHFVMAIDVNTFIPIDAFKSRVAALIALINGSELAPGFKEILMPGEREFRTEQARRELGIPLSIAVLDKLRSLAEELGLDFDL
jgi:LDH2 family malate/lactate/ureidoglycolate dehydrogenase